VHEIVDTQELCPAGSNERGYLLPGLDRQSDEVGEVILRFGQMGLQAREQISQNGYLEDVGAEVHLLDVPLFRRELRLLG
jgi:hypothetical protein